VRVFISIAVAEEGQIGCIYKSHAMSTKCLVGGTNNSVWYTPRSMYILIHLLPVYFFK